MAPSSHHPGQDIATAYAVAHVSHDLVTVFEPLMKLWNLRESEQAGDFFGPDLAADERTWEIIQGL